jgi:hypothetical protein
VWCLSGAFWTWHSWDGCEGIHDLDYRAPGEEFTRFLVEFCRGLPFWRMAPNFTAVRCEPPGLVTACLADPDRNTVAAYLCTPDTGGQVTGATVLFSLPAGRYRLEVRHPSSLGLLHQEEFDAEGIWRPVRRGLPPFTDDVLLSLCCVQGGRRVAMPGTG